MASSTAKKVQVERWERDPLSGFVNSQSCVTDAGIELLSQSGAASVVPYSDVKAVHFVRDFEPGPVRITRKTFNARPKLPGLWVRLRFRDGDLVEAILPNDLLQVEPFGVTVIPPDVNGNTQRLFIPRAALREIQVLSVVGSPLRRVSKGGKPAPGDQIGLFE